MAQQAEDNELRDLVIEALEKNGSLAKIRALLRANIFLAFEDGYDNIKQNLSLDNVLNISEGSICLSIVHEFLEFCNLKNTLFVYMSESRQGKEYSYEGRKTLAENLNISKIENVKEPIMITLLRNVLKQNKKTCEKSVRHDSGDNNHREDQNCTYIVHEDTSSISQSNSDNSSDEKNKLHLRLQLDNSDTDTSSDSAREKSSSEYIPNAHVIEPADIKNKNETISPDKLIGKDNKNELKILTNFNSRRSVPENKLNTSSDTTSYVELKSFNPLDQKLLNTTGLPVIENFSISNDEDIKPRELNPQLSDLHSNVSNIETPLSGTFSSGSLNSYKSENVNKSALKTDTKESIALSKKSDNDTIDYSYDFTSSGSLKKKECLDNNSHLTFFEGSCRISSKFSNADELISPHQHSLSSKSSISISDIADLIDNSADLSGALDYIDIRENMSERNKQCFSNYNKSNNSDKEQNKSQSNEPELLSESSVQSLSNLSLDVHSA